MKAIFIGIIVVLVIILIVGVAMYIKRKNVSSTQQTVYYQDGQTVPGGKKLVTAFYGIANDMVDVTEYIRDEFVEDGVLTSFTVNVANMGGIDPAAGVDKILVLTVQG